MLTAKTQGTQRKGKGFKKNTVIPAQAGIHDYSIPV
jgi:hypothetical protein